MLALREADTAWRHRTVGSLLEEHARGRGSHPFLISEDTLGNETRLTYAEMAGRARRLAAGLRRVGVERGDRVALWMTNLPEFLVSQFAVMRLGAVLVPINTHLGPSEVAYVLRTSGARHLIVLDRFRKVDFTEMLLGLVPEWATAAPGELCSAALPDLRTVIVHARGGGTARANAYGLGALMAEDDPEPEAATPEDPALIVFTSGSTGFPKGVRLAQWGLVTNGSLHTRRLGIRADDRYFTQLPLFHVGASIWGLMTVLVPGATFVVGEANDPEQAARLVERERCTLYNCAPAMHYGLLEEVKARPRDLRSVRMAAHLVDETLRRELWEPFGVTRFWAAYGMTESYGAATVPAGGNPAEHSAGVGTALDGVEVRVVEPGTDRDAGPDATGEILIRGMVMLGYHEMPEQTAAVVDPAGWLHTEDLGTLGRDGLLTFVGRLKAMLKVGGENVAAEEVEGVLRAYPGVADACVVARPDARLNEVPRAYLRPQSGATVDLDGLRAFAEPRLARFKRPRDYVVLDEFPLIGSGKVDRMALARLAQES